jgi:hypothetical protein
VSIQKQNLGTGKFPIQKWMIFYKFKEIKELRVPQLAAGTNNSADCRPAESGMKKGHFWMETSASYHMFATR